MPDTAATAAVPPFSNTGGNLSPIEYPTYPIALIDWFAFTITPPDGCGLDWLWPYLRDLFALPSMEQEKRLGNWLGYATCFNLGGLGKLGIGGESQNGTIHVSLTGAGCAHVPNWQAVHDWLQTIKVRITRIDLAHDDFTGETLNIEIAKRWYLEGLFKTGGRNPSHNVLGDWLDPDSPKGRTLGIGNRSSGKYARIYEKGKEQNFPNSRWTRAEVQLSGKSRVIPLDVLLRPCDYLAGAYPCFAFLSTVQERIRTVSKVVSMSFDAAVKHTRSTGGKVVNMLRTYHHGDDSKVVEALLRSGFPKRLAGYEDLLPLAKISGVDT
ncbi:MAG: replication initiation factor domain-containing protein [Methylobacillus sp.]|jgi:phage replication initiation protein|nr:replication initiation factor domain-containing protein [Methylobacillus sp.]